MVQETGIKTIPMEKKRQKATWLSGKAFHIAVRRREAKSKGEKTPSPSQGLSPQERKRPSVAGYCEETHGEEAEDGGRVLRGPGWWKPDAGLFSESWRQ